LSGKTKLETTAEKSKRILSGCSVQVTTVLVQSQITCHVPFAYYWDSRLQINTPKSSIRWFVLDSPTCKLQGFQRQPTIAFCVIHAWPDLGQEIETGRMASTLVREKRCQCFTPVAASHYNVLPPSIGLFVWLVDDDWCWLILRENYCWLIVGGWFVLREKYCWLCHGVCIIFVLHGVIIHISEKSTAGYAMEYALFLSFIVL
jgi:hypothetical protein